MEQEGILPLWPRPDDHEKNLKVLTEVTDKEDEGQEVYGNKRFDQ